MYPIIALDDSSFDLPIDLDSPNTANIEPEFPEESIDQLIERANLQITAATSKIETSSATVLSTLTVRATSEMEAAIDSLTPIDVMNATDDDVIFVGEENTVINLCSPDKGPRTSRLLPNQNNGKSTVTAATKSVPQTGGESDPMTNSVMCAVCMESSVGREPHSTKCGHIFCGACIKEAIKITRKCPLCNKLLTLKNLMPVFI
ncbi:hypothetical protein HA402_003402 [Bradysia odoriphaga]|nr:hypothetical protein HA402_003402 [Bradysia odoriphaga]